MMARTNELNRYRNDLLYGIAACLIATGFVLYNGIRNIVELFSTPGAITARAPLLQQPFTAEIGGGTPAVVDSAVLTVHDVSAVSVACLILGIVLSTVGLITAAVLASSLCVRLLRGTVFDRVNIRLLTAISILLTAAALCAMSFRTMGLNGVFAAADGDFHGGQKLFFEQLPLFGVALAVAVLVIVFRRGAALQKDAEGLV